MKIALCLHGYFDSQKDKFSLGEEGYKHIKKHILDGNDVDIYIHTWDIPHQEQIRECYGKLTKKAVYEPQIDFKPLYEKNGLDKLPIHGTPFYNVFSHFYSVQKAFELMLESGIKYDIVIKARFDLGQINKATANLHEYSSVACIPFDPTLDMTKFHMAYWSDRDLNEEGPADMWFYSNQKNMSQFSKIYDIISESVHVDNADYIAYIINNTSGMEKDGGMVNALKALKWFLIKTKLWGRQNLLKTTWD
jgi:hypothetical protein